MVGPVPAMTSGGACMRARVVSSKPVAPDHTLSPITSIRSDAAGSGTTAAGVSASASVTAGVSAPSGAYTAIIPFAAMRSAQTAASALLGSASRPIRAAGSRCNTNGQQFSLWQSSPLHRHGRA